MAQAKGARQLARAWPRSGIILLHDVAGSIVSLIGSMADHGEWFPVIAFSDDPKPARIVEAILDGAIDYIAWPIAGDELAATLDRALDRAERVGNAKLREIMARSQIDKLTRREREVLNGVAGGLSNRLIGERLEISPRTVEIHRANMLHKLGANHTSDAIRVAIEADLTE
ncbi:MAG: LuxR C-terminal-related transcriptional regulator [Novosphingobium sp.]|nr:LuxR C-terminal-related transcriptional regulator [Novosphingobium sp.]